MSEITVTAQGPAEFDVQVQDDDQSTSHRVTVPDALVDELQLQDVDNQTLVKESFAFLLEREPASSIMREFSLDEIRRYFPEYPDEIRQRLA